MPILYKKKPKAYQNSGKIGKKKIKITSYSKSHNRPYNTSKDNLKANDPNLKVSKSAMDQAKAMKANANKNKKKKPLIKSTKKARVEDALNK